MLVFRKAKLSLRLIKHPDKKVNGGVKLELQEFLDSAQGCK
jgi:hypothetical protein